MDYNHILNFTIFYSICKLTLDTLGTAINISVSPFIFISRESLIDVYSIPVKSQTLADSNTLLVTDKETFIMHKPIYQY